MKSIEKISLVLRPLTLATLLIGLEALMLFSCQKEASVNTDDLEELNDTPDQKNDLVAFLDPLAGILWADSAHVENALSLLGAVPFHENAYIKPGITPGGRPVQIRFTVQLSNTTEIYAQATAADANNTNPDLIKAFEEAGTKYKVYKNAECGKGGPGFTSECENLGDGASKHRVWNAYPFPQCKRGKGFCVEVLAVAGVEVTFFNQGCQGLIKSSREMLVYQCQ